MKVPFQGRTTYYDTFCFVEPCFGLWFDGCLDFFAMIFPVVHIGAIAVSFLFVVMMFNIQIAEIHEEVLRYLPGMGLCRIRPTLFEYRQDEEDYEDDGNHDILLSTITSRTGSYQSMPLVVRGKPGGHLPDDL
ncbi:NADH-ubiquinone oxidoreductase chain 6 [Sesamum angolense]|uniref:NADH-ubiquinone oxidoreductase chain 6 n=1 Tax=Sesamum angolense TaxID=2727404 RepID=A0AAE1T3M1_9LAMI|nr:NADH-ubiquinone oxidoreductase chain 6 [Sesamum angolense]